MPDTLPVAKDQDDWTPPGYKTPDEDAPTITREHPHPLDDDQNPEG